MLRASLLFMLLAYGILLLKGNAILILGCTTFGLTGSAFLKERTMMLRQQRLIYLPLIGTALLCALVGAYLMLWRRSSKPKPPASVVEHTVETPAADVLKYWTADKMRTAAPAPLPQVNTREREKRQPRRPPQA